MSFFAHDGLQFSYSDDGEGLPVLFQHGLGTNWRQIVGVFPPGLGIRLVSMDFRGHGETQPVGPSEKISFAAFADDLVALLDRLGIAQAVVGGSSMGAAVALNLCLRFPARVRGLILLRPCWLDQPLPPHARVFPSIARCLREYGAKEGRRLFSESEEYQALLQKWPYVTPLLLGLFDSPRAEDTAICFERIARDAPCRSLQELAAIRVPTLVLPNPDDPVHPLEYGAILANAIAGAKLRALPAKSQGEAPYAAELQRHLAEFLQTEFKA